MDTSEIYWSEYYNLTEVSMYTACFVSRKDAIIFTVIVRKCPRMSDSQNWSNPTMSNVYQSAKSNIRIVAQLL